MPSFAVMLRNRANAKRSTGPRTAAGKARAARNAHCHGLSLPVLADPALAPAVAALARTIAGPGATAACHALAVSIADAEIDLVRVRRVRLELTAQLDAGRNVIRQLLRIECYEQRAWSRRQTAITAFDAAERTQSAERTHSAERTQSAERSQLAERTQSAERTHVPEQSEFAG